MKNKKRARLISFIIIGGLVFGGLVFSFSKIQAQENLTAPPEGKTQVEPILVASVNIYNAKIVSQEGNTLKISFDIYNRVNVQPQIKYAVQLKSEKQSDEKVYPEVLGLGENDTITKEIIYTAPEYLNGKFQVWITAKNESGLSLALNNAGEAELNGGSQFLEMNENFCHLRVEGEAGDKQYTLGQGVDIKPEEKLVGTCGIWNHYDRNITFVPKFETHWRNVFGEIVKDNQEPQPELTIKANEKKNFDFTLPKAKTPQAYDAVLILQENGQTISNPIVFHYVLRGMSATIQNLRLDKDYYKQGESAIISFNLTGSADSFPGSRFGKTEPGKIFAEVAIANSDKKSCVAAINKEISRENMIKTISWNTPMLADCSNPLIRLSIKDGNGNILDEKNFQVESKNISKPEENKKVSQSADGKQKMINVIKYFIGALVLLSVILLIVRAAKKNKNIYFLVFFLFIAGTVFFINGQKAKADSWNLYWDGNLATYTVNLNKNVFNVGESVYVHGSGSPAPICDNTNGISNYSITITSTNGSDSVNVLLESYSYSYSTSTSTYKLNDCDTLFASLCPTGWTPAMCAGLSDSCHQFSAPNLTGSRSVKLYLTNASSATNVSLPYTVNAVSVPPTATIGLPVADQNVVAGSSVNFSGTGADSGGNQITAYEWRLGDCVTGALQSSVASFSSSFPNSGTYTFYFRVMNSLGTWSTNCPSRTITVANNNCEKTTSECTTCWNGSATVSGTFPCVGNCTGGVCVPLTSPSCTPSFVDNGTVGPYPTCAITCNSGYSPSGSACVADSGQKPGWQEVIP